MAFGARRLFSTRSSTTCLAWAKAASVASLLPNISRNADIAGRTVVPHLRCALAGGVLHAHHRRQRLVVDLDQLGGVARLAECLGHHEGDTVADEAHLLGGEQRLERAMALRGAEILRHQVRREGAEMLGRGIGPGQHGEDAGRGLRLRGIDAADACVGVRRIDERPVALVRQVDVVDIATAAGEEPLVLHSTHRLTDSEFGHVSPHSLCWLEREPSACPGKVGTGFPTRKCANERSGSGSVQQPLTRLACRPGKNRSACHSRVGWAVGGRTRPQPKRLRRRGLAPARGSNLIHDFKQPTLRPPRRSSRSSRRPLRAGLCVPSSFRPFEARPLRGRAPQDDVRERSAEKRWCGSPHHWRAMTRHARST